MKRNLNVSVNCWGADVGMMMTGTRIAVGICLERAVLVVNAVISRVAVMAPVVHRSPWYAAKIGCCRRSDSATRSRPPDALRFILVATAMAFDTADFVVVDPSSSSSKWRPRRMRTCLVKSRHPG